MIVHDESLRLRIANHHQCTREIKPVFPLRYPGYPIVVPPYRDSLNSALGR